MSATISRAEVIPTGAEAGAEIRGVDVARELDAASLEVIETALDRHGVVFLRDQSLTPDQQIGFGRRFGEPEINYNSEEAGLPDHPEMIEQRIGRLDRIGQRETVHIHVPYREHSGEERLVRWLHEGLDAFETRLSGGDETHPAFRDSLEGHRDRRIADIRGGQGGSDRN